MGKHAIVLFALVAVALLARFAPAQENPPAAPPQAAQAEGGDSPPSSSAPPAQAPRTPPAAATPPQAPRADVFTPSEEIQADEEITFPIDI